jgi:hypothetical protein
MEGVQSTAEVLEIADMTLPLLHPRHIANNELLVLCTTHMYLSIYGVYDCTNDDKCNCASRE